MNRWLLPLLWVGPACVAAEEAYVSWNMREYAIEEPLAGLKGDAVRGMAIARDRRRGNCLACHRMPIPEEDFQGTIGPPLQDVGLRLTEGQIRLRIVDQKQINPMSIMPGFYRNPKYYNRVADEYEGKTPLSPQEVEDLVAYLVTLKGGKK
jgi:sulfur-oxidizing protein SoxX